MADLQRAMETPVPGASTAPTGIVKRRAGSHGVDRARRKPAKKVAKKRKPGRPKGALNAALKVKRTNARNAVNMDLGSALALVQGMHRTDVATFQSISGLLSDKGKPSRKRLLTAINKVFG